MKFVIALAFVLSCTFFNLRPALALPADLFISEYIEGSSNNKALEIYNGTGAAVNLTASDYTIEMYFNGGTTSTLTHHLTGTIANNDVFVLTNSAATLPGITSVSDQTTASTGWYNGNDVVVLRKNNGGTIVDVIGQIGNNPGTEWGTGLTSTADNTLRRRASVCAGDPNGSDAFEPSLQWDGFAVDNTVDLGTHTANCGGGGDAAPTVSTVSPANGGRIGTSGNLTVTFSEPVTASSVAFSLICTASGNVALSATGGPTTFTLDPVVNLAPADVCSLIVDATLVTDQDGAPTPMSSDFMSSFSVIPCGAAATTISAVQGSGLSSPLVGSVVEIEGVVVGSFPGSAGLGGFFLQQQVGDGNPATSEGIFVSDPTTSVAVQLGDVVRVRGKVDEFFNLTEINTLEFAVVCSNGATLPVPATVSMPFASLDAPERFEGMRVSFPANALFVTENYNQGRYGEVTLAAGGRQFAPTAVATPGPAATAVDTSNKLARIQLDDGSDVQNPSPNVPYLGANGTLRPGDRVSNELTGVLSYSFSTYEVHPTAPVTFAQTARPSAMPSVAGRLKVASYNILNYFTHLQPTSSSIGCGPTGALECRGANTASEYARQRAKTKASLVGLSADIYGLAELQNNTPTDPDVLIELVAMLNEAFGSGAYNYVDTGAIGTDAIKVGFIYKTSSVEVAPGTTPRILQTSAFIPSKSRPALAVTFREKATGAKFTTIMNHLKSKGSSCSDIGDAVDPNGQGECNQTRVAAVNELKRWIATELPALTGDPDYLLMGDMNAYTKEDPIVAFEAGGFVDLGKANFGSQSYDYVFDGGAGALTHVLANASMNGQISGVVEWHSNSDEPRAFDFEDFNQPSAYQPNLWRAADHDAILVGLNPGAATASPMPATPGWSVALAFLSLLGVLNRRPRSRMA